MSTQGIAAIDVHGHYGQYVGRGHPQSAQFMSGDASTVAKRALALNIEWTIVSPLTGLFPRGRTDAAAGNREAADMVPRTPGLLQYVLIDPTQPETYDQADEMLGLPWCVGIKIHPEEHVYPIVKHGRKIFEFAARHRAVILTHSGEQNSLPADFIPFANDYPEVKLILAHIGCGFDGDPTHQVRAIQQSKHGNVVADTSSAQSIMPNLIEFAVREIGVERVLFGTDTPLYSTAMHRARIDQADLSDSDKRKILRDNAVALLGLDPAALLAAARTA